MHYNYDLFVIGAGSGGVRAARLAGKTGARVAIAEQVQVGGTCVLRGCVPKKLMVYGAEFPQAFMDAQGFGWTLHGATFDWATLRDNVHAEVNRLSGLYSKNLAAANVEVFNDRAELAGPHEIKLVRTGRTVSAQRILIATGGHTYRPLDTPGQELGVTSTDAFMLDALPKSILIAGGGYIALEFATIFNGLGVDTTVIYRGDRILRGFDAEVRAHVETEMQRSGVKFIYNTVIDKIDVENAGKRATLSNGETRVFEQVMWAIGREPNTKGLGLEVAGVLANERGAIVVDAHSRTNLPSIWAVGDVTDRINLTPVAIREAQAFAMTEFMAAPTTFDHADVASAVFCKPAVGAIGLTQEAARTQGLKLKIFRSVFRPMRHILAGNEQRSLMKLIVNCADDRVVGVHIVGAEGPELIQLAAVAVKAGLTKAQWDATCAVHPTAAEELVLLGEPVSHDVEAPA